MLGPARDAMPRACRSCTSLQRSGRCWWGQSLQLGGAVSGRPSRARQDYEGLAWGQTHGICRGQLLRVPERPTESIVCTSRLKQKSERSKHQPARCRAAGGHKSPERVPRVRRSA